MVRVAIGADARKVGRAVLLTEQREMERALVKARWMVDAGVGARSLCQ